MVLDAVLEELRARNTYKAEVYAPYYMISWAIHLFNLHNQKSKIYWEGSRLPSLRLHLLFVAPPGFMKTYYLEQMLRGKYCILGNTVPKTFEAVMTEAGLIGTISSMEGSIWVESGVAKDYATGIVGVDEFSAITQMLKTTHSGQLDVQLLSVLDSGWAYKRLAHGKLEYQTQFTLWAGVQPARYDLTSGLGRRLCFLLFLPTPKEADELLVAWAGARGIRPNVEQIEELWRKLKQVKQEIQSVETIEFDPGLLQEYRSLGIFPYEGSLYDRIILGYHLLRNPGKRVYVTLDDKEVKRLVHREVAWRRQISVGSEYKQVMQILVELGGKASRSVLMQNCMMLGWDIEKFVQVLTTMQRLKLVRFDNQEVTLV